MRLTARFVIISLLLPVVACAETGGDLIDSRVETAVVETVSAQRLPAQESPPVNPPQTSFICPDCQLVEVIRVIDGDTIDTSIGRVRFFGVDTPERGEMCFREATEFTRLLVGSQVRLEDGPRLEDNYGRRLAYIYDHSGESIDVQLIAGGYARAWTQDGQHRDVLVGLERGAKLNQAGCLWAGGGSVETGRYDPAGSDRDCGNFRTWREANDFFVAAGGPTRDPHRLDGDGDGVPCESLR